MSTARSTVSAIDHRLASSIQFVVSHGHRQLPCEQFEKPPSLCMKFVASSSTWDESTQSVGIPCIPPNGLEASSGDSVTCRNDLHEEFIPTNDDSEANSARCILLACGESLLAIHESETICESFQSLSSTPSRLEQCIWCCRFQDQRERNSAIEMNGNEHRSTEWVISQRVCSQCRLQLIDRVRQSLFS